MTARRVLFLFALTAVLTHAAGALLGGSFNPGDWPVLVTCSCIFVFAPCTALALCVLEGVV